MEKEQIKEIIRKNPNLPYDKAKSEALDYGIAIEIFDEAWNEIHSDKIGAHRTDIKGLFNFKHKYPIFLFAYFIIGIETQALYGVWFWHGGELPLWIKFIDETSAFSINILLFHFSAKLLGMQGSIYKSTGLAILMYLISTLSIASSQSPAFLYVGVLFLVMTFYILMKAYGIGVMKTILFILLNGLLYFIAILLVQGFYKLNFLIFK